MTISPNGAAARAQARAAEQSQWCSTVYDGTAKTRRIDVTLEVEISHRDPVATLNETVAQWLRDHAEPDG